MNNNNSKENDWTDWIQLIKLYIKPSIAKSWWQIINSFVPYVILWIAMIYSINISYWLTLALSVLAAGFLTRIFIIFHDCGHGSFFESKLMNRIVGIIFGAMVFTPYHRWHYQHKVHHQTVGNLDKRGVGDVKLLTVNEFKNSSKAKQLYYRVYRHPITLFVLAPFILFAFASRFPNKNYPKNTNIYTHLTTLGLIVAISIFSFFIGFKTYLLIQVPILIFASSFGVWLFYIQHQFADVVWERTDNWDYKTIAMYGSSYVKFPRVIQWFSGNIGFHHIHHLSPKIPNYNLEKCLNENPLFQKKPLTFYQSLQTVNFRLWDEEKHKLVGFKEAMRTI